VQTPREGETKQVTTDAAQGKRNFGVIRFFREEVLRSRESRIPQARGGQSPNYFNCQNPGKSESGEPTAAKTRSYTG